MGTTKPKIIIVDQNDQIIGEKHRNEVGKNDIYRVSALWITNSSGDILLAKRHHTKSHGPSEWGPAVAGTVDAGESYEQNILKEAEEELGLTNIQPTLGPKTETTGQYHHFTQWFLLTLDKDVDDFRLQEDEVEEVQWISPQNLQIELDRYPEKYLPTMKKYLGLFSS